MRGFRGNRAIQNQFSSRYGNQGPGATSQDPVKDYKQNGGNPRPRPDLPDWMKTPETLAAEKGTVTATAAATPTPATTPPKLRVIEGGAAKTNTTKTITKTTTTKTTAKAPPSKGRKVAAVPARKTAKRKAA